MDGWKILREVFVFGLFEKIQTGIKLAISARQRMVSWLFSCLRRITYSLKVWKLSRRTTKPTKWHVRPAKTQISLGIRQVWSEPSTCSQSVAKDQCFFWRTAKTLIRLGGCPGWSESSLGTHAILSVLSCGGSLNFEFTLKFVMCLHLTWHFGLHKVQTKENARCFCVLRYVYYFRPFLTMM